MKHWLLRARNSLPPSFACLAGLAVAIEGCVTLAVMHHHFGAAAAAHVTVTALIGWSVASRFRKGEDSKLSALWLVMVGATGLFGALCSLCVSFIHRRPAQAPDDFMEWFRALFPEEESEEGMRVHERIVSGAGSQAKHEDVEPFGDILDFGTLRQKQEALAKMTRYFTPAFAPLLRGALDSPDNAVRVSAATALAKIERDYMQRYIQAEKEHKQNPDDAGRAIRLGACCEDYANSGLADGISGQSYRQKAIALYENLPPAWGNDPEITMALSRLYGGIRDMEKSHFYFEQYLIGQNEPKPEAVVAYMETLCKMGAFKRMRELASQYVLPVDADKAHELPGAAQVLHQWAGIQSLPAM